MPDLWCCIPSSTDYNFLDTMYTRSEGRKKSTKEDHSGLYGVKEEEELNYMYKNLSIKSDWFQYALYTSKPSIFFQSCSKLFPHCKSFSIEGYMITNDSREVLASAREPLPYFLEVCLPLRRHMRENCCLFWSFLLLFKTHFSLLEMGALKNSCISVIYHHRVGETVVLS